MQTMKELDLRKQPFARAGSRFLIMEKPGEDGGLYVSIASGSLSMFGGSGDPHEVLKIEIMEDGETVPFEYRADPFCLTVKGKKGTVRFAIDGYFLIVEGNGLTVHFSAKKGGAFLSDSIKMTVDGALIPIKGVKMTVIQQTGTQELIAPWDPKLRGSANPDLYLRPDASGNMRCVIVDQTNSEEEYTDELTVDSSAEGARKDFEGFCSRLIRLPERFEELTFTLAYALWSGLQPTMEGVQAYCTNKVTDIGYMYHEQAVAALAFADPVAVLETICLFRTYLLPDGAILGEQRGGRNIYAADVPLLGLAARHAAVLPGIESADRGVVQRAYDILACRADWWIRNRSDGEGRFRYAFRRESGSIDTPCFDTGCAVIAPDLAAYMCLLFSGLAGLAGVIGDAFSERKWQEMAEREIGIVQELWDDRTFTARDAETGDRLPCGELGLMPAVLGALLPDDIAEELTRSAGCRDLVRTCLIVKGLYEAGRTRAAREAAERIMEYCITSGTALRVKPDTVDPGAYYSPAVCAALLSLGTVLSE